MRKVITSEEELLRELPSWRNIPFSFDVETTGLDFRKDRLLGLALYFADDRAYYIVFEHNVEEQDEVILKQFISRDMFKFLGPTLFSQDEVIMTAHNAKFDMHFLHKLGVYVEGKLFDTLLAAQLLDETRDNGLKALAPLVGMQYDKYMGLVKYAGYNKDEILGAALEDVAQYAMNDVESTWKLYNLFKYQLVEEGVEPMFRNISMPLLITLQQMEARGIALDLDKVREMHAEYSEKTRQAAEKIDTLGLQKLVEYHTPQTFPENYLRMATDEELEYAFTNAEGNLVIEYNGIQIPVVTYEDRGRSKTYRPRVPHFSVGSSKKVHDLIFEWLDIEVNPEWGLQKNTTGFKADKDNIDMLGYFLGDKSPEVLKEIITYRKSSKFLTTYLDNFLLRADPNDHNSITTSFNQATHESGGTGGTRTGRLSSSSPNLQNIPSRGEIGKQARSMFVARPGYKLVVADYSAMEMVIWAHFSEDQRLIESISQGLDMHSMTAAGQRGLTYDEFMVRLATGDPQVKEWRAVGKTSNFGALYGIGARKFQRFLLVQTGVLVTVDEAQRLLNAIDETYPQGYAWKQKVWAFVRKNGYVLTMGRRKRRLPLAINGEFWQKREAERQAVSTIIQGSCGDIVCEAMPPIQKALTSLGGSLLLQVHDELVAEMPEDRADLGAILIPELMTGLVNPKLRCKLSVEAHIGDSWGEAKG